MVSDVGISNFVDHLVQGYHLLAAALFAPVLVLQPRLLALALGVALLVMVAAEVVRLGRVPVLSALLAGRLYTHSLNTTRVSCAFSNFFSLYQRSCRKSRFVCFT